MSDDIARVRLMLDYDSIDDWAPLLGRALEPVVSEAARHAVAQSNPQYIEDARDTLLSLASRPAVIDGTLCWLRSNILICYHGSRLTAEDTASIRARGLIPLRAAARRHRIERALSHHPRWAEVARRLDGEIRRYSSAGGARRMGAAGNREGQVHLTLSKAGLSEGFNHYLTHGSEFDQHVAYALLGDEGVEALANDGAPTLVMVAVPGEDALAGAHPNWSVDDVLRMGELPNLVREFLGGWAFRLANPSFQTRTQQVDCGIRFAEAIPVTWIHAIQPVLVTAAREEAAGARAAKAPNDASGEVSELQRLTDEELQRIVDGG